MSYDNAVGVDHFSKPVEDYEVLLRAQVNLVSGPLRSDPYCMSTVAIRTRRSAAVWQYWS